MTSIRMQCDPRTKAIVDEMTASFVDEFCVVGKDRSTTTAEFFAFLRAYVMQKWLPRRGLRMMPGGGVGKWNEDGAAGFCDDPHIECAAWMLTTDASHTSFSWDTVGRWITTIYPHTLMVGNRIVGLDIAGNAAAYTSSVL